MYWSGLYEHIYWRKLIQTEIIIPLKDKHYETNTIKSKKQC
jgi:hypothetical protein